MDITSGQPTLQVGGSNDTGGWGIMFLAFLALLGGGGGGGFFGGRGNPLPNNIATTDTVNQAVQYSSLVDQNRDLTSQIGQVQSNTMQYVGDRYNELQRDISNNALSIANLAAQQQQCCSNIREAIANQTLRTTEQFATLQQRLDQQEIQQLRAQVNNLQNDLRMQGVIRYPQGYAYNAGPGPFQAAPFPPVTVI